MAAIFDKVPSILEIASVCLSRSVLRAAICELNSVSFAFIGVHTSLHIRVMVDPKSPDVKHYSERLFPSIYINNSSISEASGPISWTLPKKMTGCWL